MNSDGDSDIPPESSSSARQNAERRLLARLPGYTLAPVFLGETQDGLPASVHDISVEGIGLITDHPLEPGTALTIRSRQTPTLNLQAQVRHKHNLPENKWLLGCAFARRLKTEDIMMMG